MISPEDSTPLAGGAQPGAPFPWFGGNPKFRIVLAGYSGEHDPLTGQGWRTVPWKAGGGYGSQGKGRGRDNANLERLWLSPHCLDC